MALKTSNKNRKKIEPIIESVVIETKEVAKEITKSEDTDSNGLLFVAIATVFTIALVYLFIVS